jgi:hypothetical protein
VRGRVFWEKVMNRWVKERGTSVGEILATIILFAFTASVSVSDTSVWVELALDQIYVYRLNPLVMNYYLELVLLC